MTLVAVVEVALRLVGWVGGVVSVQGRVETMMVVLVELLPEASNASTASV